MNLCNLKHLLRPWVCDVGRQDHEGRALTPGMVPAGHLWGRGSPWTACWPGVPGAAGPPLPASGGAALLQPDLHQQPPHTAYRKKRRGLYLVGQQLNLPIFWVKTNQTVTTWELESLHIRHRVMVSFRNRENVLVAEQQQPDLCNTTD